MSIHGGVLVCCTSVLLAAAVALEGGELESHCTATLAGGDGVVTCEPLVAAATAKVSVSLPLPVGKGTSLPSSSTTTTTSGSGSTDTYYDGQVYAYSAAPLTIAPKNATVANIISGAANKHELSADDYVTLAVAASSAASSRSVFVSPPLRWSKLADTAVNRLRASAAQTMPSSVGSMRFFPSKNYADTCNIDESDGAPDSTAVCLCLLLIVLGCAACYLMRGQ